MPVTAVYPMNAVCGEGSDGFSDRVQGIVITEALGALYGLQVQDSGIARHEAFFGIHSGHVKHKDIFAENAHDFSK